jgi:hypothetical protein
MTAKKSTSAKSPRATAGPQPKAAIKRSAAKRATKASPVAARKIAAKKVVSKRAAAGTAQAKHPIVVGKRGSSLVSTEVKKGRAAAQPITKVADTDTRPRGERGGRIGRPRTRMEVLKPVPTRCPAQIYTYLKGITPFLYQSLTAMFEDMIRRFLKERPWEHGLHWRKPKTAMTYANGMAGTTGWVQVNIQLPQELAESVAKVASVCGVSNACLCYTAIFWWVQYIYPPGKMLGTANKNEKRSISNEPQS